MHSHLHTFRRYIDIDMGTLRPPPKHPPKHPIKQFKTLPYGIVNIYKVKHAKSNFRNFPGEFFCSDPIHHIVTTAYNTMFNFCLFNFHAVKLR